MHTSTHAAAPHWRFDIPEHRRRHLRWWFLSGAALTFAILVIGGITRLTQSGLSIVDWQPIMGVIPPIGEEQWREAFERYRQFPEYQQLRRGMSLDEFKFIFFWEYIHRVAARLIGLVFLIPFLFFLVRGYFTRPLLRWTLVLFALGGMQGLMGWLMVASGLVDRPSVSHYRLAAHLSLALVIFGCCYWLARQMDVRPAKAAPAGGAGPGAGAGSVYLLGALLSLQIFWGALVAGLKAGRIFNTFPLMGDGLIPPGAWYMRPWVLNLLENPATVQWTHRVLGTTLAAVAVWVWLRARRDADARVRHLAGVFAGLIAVQYLLGVLTLLMRVPVSLGVLHQAVAVVILGVWIAWLHHIRTRPHAGVAPLPAAERSVAGLPR